jgi:GcrA cell cycle regulator
MSWTDERIERLKELWSKGMTASQIAEELGGFSRNAIIGKAHRLGLQSRPSPVKPNDPPPTAQAAGPAAVAPADAPDDEDPFAAAPASDEQLGAAEPSAAAAAPAPVPAQPQQRIVSVGPGGFLRQGPGRPSPRPRRVGWSPPSRAPRSPTRPACSI